MLLSACAHNPINCPVIPETLLDVTEWPHPESPDDILMQDDVASLYTKAFSAYEDNAEKMKEIKTLVRSGN
jgi:hypothetical protein